MPKLGLDELIWKNNVPALQQSLQGNPEVVYSAQMFPSSLQAHSPELCPAQGHGRSEQLWEAVSPGHAALGSTSTSTGIPEVRKEHSNPHVLLHEAILCSLRDVFKSLLDKQSSAHLQRQNRVLLYRLSQKNQVRGH